MIVAQPTICARLICGAQSLGILLLVVGIKSSIGRKGKKQSLCFRYLSDQQYIAFCGRWVELRPVPKETCHTWVSWHCFDAVGGCIEKQGQFFLFVCFVFF